MKVLCFALLLAAVLAETPTAPPDTPDIEGGYKPTNNLNLKDDEVLDGGDVILSKEQYDALYGERRAFGGSFRYARMWTDGIFPYVFKSGDFWASTRTDIEKAMRVIEADTCIRFRKRTNEKSWVQIQDDGSGCNSYLGDISRDNGQPLNLANNGCLQKCYLTLKSASNDRACESFSQFGTYLHELGHALGMLHEHQLPTRNDYVHYHKNNIDPDNISQLKMYRNWEANLHGSEYDLSSVMHYELTAFSKDRVSKTLSVENTFWEPHIGRRYSHMLSFGDVRTLNKMYNCAARCGGKTCEGQAFLNKDCVCVTPESYYSKYCKDDPEQVAWCEGKAKSGYCDRTDDYMQTHCTKTCDFCPKFLPGTSGKVKPESTCVNQYSYDDTCERWAKEGACSDYPVWMQRHCRKSCHKYEKTCDKNIGRCANRLSDHDCEGYAHHWLWSYCTSPKHWGRKAQIQCQDSCGLCPDDSGVIWG